MPRGLYAGASVIGQPRALHWFRSVCVDVRCARGVMNVGTVGNTREKRGRLVVRSDIYATAS